MNTFYLSTQPNSGDYLYRLRRQRRSFLGSVLPGAVELADSQSDFRAEKMNNRLFSRSPEYPKGSVLLDDE